ncbi:phosphotransferase [Nocardioides nanhaiensis]|uniref:Aminoglycoside phosphotransferase domain-containing protein n=1 Tax=Nocardioides nanhaiensis TaxID=1476871 RepID=A0ABP8WHJ6_9ACTN
MREPPPGLGEDTVLALVREHWLPDATTAVHLPLGFGAWHWQVDLGYRPTLVATYDLPTPARPRSVLDDAYAATADLAFALDAVVAPLPSTALTPTVDVPGQPGVLSCTPWVHGEPGRYGEPMTDDQAESTARTLARLHRASPPRRLPTWSTAVPSDLTGRLTTSLDDDASWRAGPLGTIARRLLAEHRDAVTADVEEHSRLLAEVESTRERWVVTHGEPHRGNQIDTLQRTLLVDWESVRLAPPERDLRWLPDPAAAGADPAVLRLVELEWRLDEVAQYALRFAGPHPGGPDDEIALAGLRDALADD